MLELARQTETTTRTRTRMRLCAADILKLMRSAGWEVPDNAKMVVHVPGGGDWSYRDLNLDENGVEVTWETTKSEKL